MTVVSDYFAPEKKLSACDIGKFVIFVSWVFGNDKVCHGEAGISDACKDKDYEK